MTREEARRVIAIWLVSSKGAKGQCGYIEGWFDEEDAEAFRMAIEALSAEAEWIPVSERLPEKHGKYLCTVEPCFLPQPYVTMYRYGKPLMPMNEGMEGVGVGWYSSDGEGDYWVDDGVLAWMPSPEPWEGGDAE